MFRFVVETYQLNSLLDWIGYVCANTSTSPLRLHTHTHAQAYAVIGKNCVRMHNQYTQFARIHAPAHAWKCNFRAFYFTITLIMCGARPYLLYVHACGMCTFLIRFSAYELHCWSGRWAYGFAIMQVKRFAIRLVTSRITLHHVKRQPTTPRPPQTPTHELNIHECGIRDQRNNRALN